MSETADREPERPEAIAGETGEQPAQPGPEAVAEGGGEQPKPAVASEPGGARETGSAEAVEGDLEALLTDTRRERDEYLELARRARADFENYRKRVGQEASAAEQRGKAAIARELMPALDNLERALVATGVDPDGRAPDGEPASKEVTAQVALAEGVALVLRELRESLSRAGVDQFDPLGERFDPSLHEAVATTEADSDPGMVVETLERGYRLGAQVIRPARVVVSG
jgi:molecular chaperone GrpE